MNGMVGYPREDDSVRIQAVPGNCGQLWLEGNGNCNSTAEACVCVCMSVPKQLSLSIIVVCIVCNDPTTTGQFVAIHVHVW